MIKLIQNYSLKKQYFKQCKKYKKAWFWKGRNKNYKILKVIFFRKDK